SASEQARSHERFCQEQDETISYGGPLLAVASDPGAFTPAARALCPEPRMLPQLTRALMLRLLCVTHSARGEIDTPALLAALPTDEDLRRLEGPLLSPAFQEQTALGAAIRLKELVDASRVPVQDGLNRVHGLTPIRPQIERLLAGLIAWQAGKADWCDLLTSALISGPTGCGKTMLARAFAAQVCVPLVTTSYAECQKAGHLGQMLAALDTVVSEAIAKAPCVFFIDEIDSFADRTIQHRNSEYQRHVVNAMLVHLTRLAQVPGVIVLAATNHPEHVDPALRRAGRLDLHLRMRYPDRAGISAILRDALGPSAPDLGTAADLLIGASGATVDGVARAALAIARQHARPATPDDLVAAAQEVVPAMAPGQIKRMAVHEAGHLLAAFQLLPTPPTSASIGPSGGTMELPIQPAITETDFRAAMIIRLAGRAAELATFGDASIGAGGTEQSDLALATRIAIDAVTRHAMFSSDLLWTPVAPEHHLTMPKHLRLRVTDLLDTANAAARQIVADYPQAIETIAQALIEHRELDAGQIADLRARILDSARGVKNSIL
uniref:AAA family ATPase n=1 Tax=Thioclava sp. TaxID=1933450 RepID=UPI003AA9B647